jgi:hypothetical protein
MGDFNLIVKDEDKNNGNLNRAMMDRGFVVSSMTLSYRMFLFMAGNLLGQTSRMHPPLSGIHPGYSCKEGRRRTPTRIPL